MLEKQEWWHLQHATSAQRTCQFIDKLATPWNFLRFLQALIRWVCAVHPAPVADGAAEDFRSGYNDICLLRWVDCNVLA